MLLSLSLIRTNLVRACGIAGLLVPVIFAATPLAAQVAIDGTTSTSVVVNADGSVSVGIAPTSANGVSLNRYDRFNVPKAGLELDNRTEAARTIVNEVTGTSRTNINGTLSVVGQRAHVIIANPNGIVIDGGRFVNTGRVALTTGQISTHSRQIAPGIFQENVMSTVTGGTIAVRGGGLSGQMDAVDLIAHSIKVDGPIVNESSNSEASINLITGETQVEFDSSVLPGNTIPRWGEITGAGATSQGATLIEITRPGVLRANRIGIEVSDIGAGVRFAGEGYATSRGFSLNANGNIELTGAKIETATTLSISAGSINVNDSALSGNNLSFASQEGLGFSDSTLNATGSILIDVKTAFVASGTAANAFGHFLITADEATIKDGKKGSELKAANGSFVLTTLGEHSEGDLNNLGGLIQGGVKATGIANSAGTESDGAVTLDVAGNLINKSTDNLAIVFGAGGEVSIRTGGDIENNRGRLLSNGDIRLIALGDVLNIVDAPNGRVDPDVVEYTRKGRRQWWTLWLKRKRESYVSFDYGTLSKLDQLSAITAVGNVNIQANSVINQGGDINANGGDLEIKALRVETIGLGSGKVSVRKTCVLTCSYESSGSVAFYGGRMNASENVKIEAADLFHNKGGTVFAIKDVEISAGEVLLEAALIPTVVNRPGGLYNFWASKSAWLFLRDQFGSIIADTGNITIKSPKPVRIIGGSLKANGELDLENGLDVVREASTRSNALGHEIGFFSNQSLSPQD